MSMVKHTHHMCVKVTPESHVNILLYPCRKWRHDLRNGIRPNASLCALGLNGLLEPLRNVCSNLVVDQLLTLIVLETNCMTLEFYK
jgi:hypothetical protein